MRIATTGAHNTPILSHHSIEYAFDLVRDVELWRCRSVGRGLLTCDGSMVDSSKFNDYQSDDDVQGWSRLLQHARCCATTNMKQQKCFLPQRLVLSRMALHAHGPAPAQNCLMVLIKHLDIAAGESLGQQKCKVHLKLPVVD